MLAVLALGGWTGFSIQRPPGAMTLQIVNFQIPLFLGRFDDWTLWEIDGNDGRICYIETEASLPKGDTIHQVKPAVLVTRLPGPEVVDEVSVRSGYAHKQDSTVRVEVDSVRFDVFRKDSRVWSVDREADEKLLAAMRKGTSMKLRGKAESGKIIEDFFSLIGLTRAHEVMSDLCSNRRGRAAAGGYFG